jgi:hypothetical protein
LSPSCVSCPTVVKSPFVMPTPPVHWCLCLLSCCHILLCCTHACLGLPPRWRIPRPTSLSY